MDKCIKKVAKVMVFLIILGAFEQIEINLGQQLQIFALSMSINTHRGDRSSPGHGRFRTPR